MPQRTKPAPALRGEREVLAPVLVVLGELVLVELAVADALLRNEGVFDAHAEVQAAVVHPMLCGHGILSFVKTERGDVKLGLT